MRLAITPSTVSGSPRSSRFGAGDDHAVPDASTRISPRRPARGRSPPRTAGCRRRGRGSVPRRRRPASRAEAFAARSSASSSPSGRARSAPRPASSSTCAYSGASRAHRAAGQQRQPGSPRRTTRAPAPTRPSPANARRRARSAAAASSRLAQQLEQELPGGLDPTLVLQLGGLGVSARSRPRTGLSSGARGPSASSARTLALGVWRGRRCPAASRTRAASRGRAWPLDRVADAREVRIPRPAASSAASASRCDLPMPGSASIATAPVSRRRPASTARGARAARAAPEGGPAGRIAARAGRAGGRR